LERGYWKVRNGMTLGWRLLDDELDSTGSKLCPMGGVRSGSITEPLSVMISFLLHDQNIAASNPCPQTGYGERDFSWFS
jgi:hypothetical protein